MDMKKRMIAGFLLGLLFLLDAGCVLKEIKYMKYLDARMTALEEKCDAFVQLIEDINSEITVEDILKN